MGNKRGISLVTLVVTIIVILIITSATILGLTNFGVLNNVNETAFKTAYEDYVKELELFHANAKIEDYAYDKSSLNTTIVTVDGVEVLQVTHKGEYYKDLDEVLVGVSSDKLFKGKLAIENGELKFIGTSEQEIEWINEENKLG